MSASPDRRRLVGQQLLPAIAGRRDDRVRRLWKEVTIAAHPGRFRAVAEVDVEAQEIDSRLDRLIVRVELPGLDPREALRHWLEPELLTRWWAVAAENDPRVGGWYHLSWPGQGWHLRGRYTILEPDRSLGFTWQWDHEPEQPLRHVAVDVAPRAEGGSVMTVTHAVYGESAAEHGVRDAHREGWLHFLGRLAAVAG